MAHEIESRNGQASMMYVGAMPWHSLGQQVPEGVTTAQAIAAAGLAWEVSLVPLRTDDEAAVRVPEHAVKRQDDGKILGVVGPRWHPLQNREAFLWFDPFLESGEASLHTAGSLRGGTRVWVLAKINREPLEIVPGDTVDKYILLSNSHDGTLAVRCGFTPVRVVCANTLAMAHGTNVASKLIRLKHTKNILQNLTNVREVMSLANQSFEASAEQYRLLARRDINEKDLRRYVQVVLGKETEQTPKGRTCAPFERIRALFEEGQGNNHFGVRGTYWAAYNAVTAWVSHERGRDAGRRLDSLWYGDAHTMNVRALTEAVAMATGTAPSQSLAV